MPCEKTLCLARQKLVQSEAIYEKSHMDLKDQFTTTWTSQFLQEQPM